MTDHLYRPGSWFALVAPRAALLVDGDFPLERLASLWEACRNRPSLNELMNLVTAGQLVDLPGFALAVADADQVRVIVRAGVAAIGSDVKGDPRSVEGAAVSTWVEDSLAPGSRVRLTRSEAKSDGVTLPVSGGVVMAEELWWQPGEVPAEEASAQHGVAVNGANGAVLNGAAANGVALNGNAPVGVGVNGAPMGVGTNGVNGGHGTGMNGFGQNAAGVNAGVNGGVNGGGHGVANGAGGQGGLVADPALDLGAQSDLERLLAAGRNVTEGLNRPAPINQPTTQVVGAGQSGLPVRPVAHQGGGQGMGGQGMGGQGMGGAGLAPMQPRPQANPDTGNPGMGNPGAGMGRDAGPADRTGDIRGLVPARVGRNGGPGAATAAAPVGDSPTTVFKAPEIALDDPSMVMGVTCRYGHVNPPQQGRCRVCGVDVPFQQPTPQQRPALGTLQFSTGQSVTLDRPVVIGRAPYADRVAGGQIPRLVRLDDEGQLISRSHVEVRLEGWNVVLEDLNSANGTYMTEPGHHPEQVEPGDAYIIEPGTEVALSQHISFVYEVGGE